MSFLGRRSIATVVVVVPRATGIASESRFSQPTTRWNISSSRSSRQVLILHVVHFSTNTFTACGISSGRNLITLRCLISSNFFLHSVFESYARWLLSSSVPFFPRTKIAARGLGWPCVVISNDNLRMVFSRHIPRSTGTRASIPHS